VSGALAGRVAVVTGAARGIGAAVAHAYAAEGAIVHALDILPPERGARGIIHHIVDVTDADAVAAIFATIEAAEGRIDVLVNNAGVITLAPVEEIAVAAWDRLIAVNLRAVFLCIRAVAPGMKQRRRGAIISVSSNAGVRGGLHESAYCASKFGLEGLSRALALEFAPYGVSVNTITPGHPVRTAMSETTYSAAMRAIWKDPAELTPAFIHLALQDASGLNDRYVRAWDLVQDLARDTPATENTA
jgi:NAD(P)-dependent dehydrogenase (short-subunit alcohol dehydrogenase family)